MIQQVLVDVIVALAAAWLVWSFAPASVRRRLRRGLAPRRKGASDASGCGCSATVDEPKTSVEMRFDG